MVVCAIAVNMLEHTLQKGKKILICAPSNSAADNIAERLAKVLDKPFIRFYSAVKEHISNIRLDLLKPYHLAYKLLEIDSTEADKYIPEILGDRLYAIKLELEYLFEDSTNDNN